MACISVVIPGPPVPQGRGRAVSTPAGVRVYDPKKSREWKVTAETCMDKAMLGAEPLSGPVRVEVWAVFACPKSEYRKRKPVLARWHTKANADADNIAKAVLDAANGIMYVDDRQVCQLCVYKVIGAQGEAPLVEVYMREVREQAD